MALDSQHCLAGASHGLEHQAGVKLLFEPSGGETLTALLSHLAQIRAKHPHSTVILHPPDHLLCPEESFVKAVNVASHLAVSHSQYVTLLGVAAAQNWKPLSGCLYTRACVGRLGRYRLFQVASFADAPKPVASKATPARPMLWNTLVMVGQASTIWKLASFCMPALTARLGDHCEAAGDDDEIPPVEAACADERVNHLFPRLLLRVPNYVIALELSDALRAEWGTRRQIAKALARIRRMFLPTFRLATRA